MENVFDIVGSFIPEEQKDDIKSQIDGKVESIVKEKETELKRELSKIYGVNLFEADLDKAYGNNKFVKKEIYDSKIKEYENTVLDFQKQINELSSENTTFKNEKLYNETNLQLLAEGFNPDRLEGIKPLISIEKNAMENVEVIKGSFPELFSASSVFTTTKPREDGKTKVKTEAQKYFESRMGK